MASDKETTATVDGNEKKREKAGPGPGGDGVAIRPGRDVQSQHRVRESTLVSDPRTNDEIFETGISEEVYEQNYRYGKDDRVPDTWFRNARALAQAEENVDEWTRKFYELLSGKGLGTGPFPFTPGGRIFANAGTGLGKATLINCLAGETLVLTDQGRKPIKELAGSTATLLTRNGKWVEAPVKSYGEQPLRKVTLSRNGQERVLYATPNHRWYVGTKATTGYKVVETDGLESYHRLERVHSRRHTATSPSAVGVARGFAFGDGNTRVGNKAAVVNLVGEKDSSLNEYYEPLGSAGYEQEGNQITRYQGIPDSWADEPIDLSESSAVLYGWAAGYFAADGCVSGNGEVIMDSCTREHIEHFIDVIEVLGIDHYGLKTQDRTSNLTGEDSTRYYVRLNPASLREEFFVLDEHRIRFRENGDRSLTYHWTVESVEETDRHETVYCAEVPEEKAFALDNGILTGNCFVSGFQGYDQDSMDEIQAELTRQAKILASEGGYGFCASVMRPRGARIGGVGSMTPGAVQMLDVWNKQAATIVAGSGLKSDRDDVKDKIRKGAQMVTLHIWHPDVLEFIEAKQEPGRLHKFNMSVLVTDEFMEAVKSGDKWALRFPDYENEKEFYKKHWDGNLKAYQEKGGTVKTWKDPATGEPAVYEARAIWETVMEATYNRNEPGVIFIDTINRENNLRYAEHIDATNPCAEQLLPIGGVCLLGNLNLTQFLRDDRSGFDWELLGEAVPRAVRFLDNVNDLSYVPLEEQQRNLQEKRRIGLGHYGDGSALMMMKTRYGSEEAARTMRRFQRRLANRAYQASARLAEKKGAFPLFDKDEYLSSPFVQRLSDKTKEMIGDLGLRNSHLLSIQPTGNTSTLGNAPSSGIEPVFMHSYIRTAEQPGLPDELERPEVIDFEGGTVSGGGAGDWAFEEQGDEHVLRATAEGLTEWQIHPTRGVCKDQEVKDYAVRHMEDFDPDAEWAVTTRELGVDDHLRMMEALAPFVDASMSKTINIPNDYPFEDFKEVYTKAWETGVIKGVTTYRAGTMSAVLSDDDESEGVPRTEAPDRPDTLPCAIHRVRYRGDHWTILVGFLEEDPYEVFAFKSEGEAPLFDNDSERVDEGYIRKNESGHYSLLGPSEVVLIDDITSHMPSDEVRVETRLVSTALRHGSRIDFLVEQLEKAEGSIASFGQSMAKALRAHTTDHEVTCEKCGSANVRHVEGCMECADCGHSRCS
jgi:ribonucleoside-diphosphate reductase alpha chain